MKTKNLPLLERDSIKALKRLLDTLEKHELDLLARFGRHILEILPPPLLHLLTPGQDGAEPAPPAPLFDPVGRGLDLIGDRWTLVLVRHLMGAA